MFPRVRAIAAVTVTTGALMATTVAGVSGGAAAAQRPDAWRLPHCGVIDYHHMRFPNMACLRLRFHAQGMVEMVETTSPGALVVKLADGRLLALNLAGNAVIRDDQGQVVSLAAIAPGDTVVAPYNVTGQGDVTREIEYLAPGTVPPTAPTPPPPPPFRTRGRIVSDTNGSLVVDTASGAQEDLTVTAQSHVTARSAGSLAAGDFFVGEAQKVGAVNDVLNLVYGTMPFWLSRHLYTGELTAASGTQASFVVDGHSYPMVLAHNAVVIASNGASVGLAANDQVRVRGSLFLGTLYASYVTVIAQNVAPAGG